MAIYQLVCFDILINKMPASRVQATVPKMNIRKPGKSTNVKPVTSRMMAIDDIIIPRYPSQWGKVLVRRIAIDQSSMARHIPTIKMKSNAW